ncbi:hypothetical protein CTI12_AA299900 [Artemisia annua]|uniref:Uncharacterized protein n=1 Tax=Artemisia annua TaxID=35608 RepID=A0A2U1MX44_ARTAN|nr:hypothetical protein CTI12_AA299900 [Artemisia annua]
MLVSESTTRIVKMSTKGCPRNATRVKPPIEVKQKKTATCSYCRESGHKITRLNWSTGLNIKKLKFCPWSQHLALIMWLLFP